MVPTTGAASAEAEDMRIRLSTVVISVFSSFSSGAHDRNYRHATSIDSLTTSTIKVSSQGANP